VLNYASSLIATRDPICRTLGAFATRSGEECGLAELSMTLAHTVER
jgi:hypothetical protein